MTASSTFTRSCYEYFLNGWKATQVTKLFYGQHFSILITILTLAWPVSQVKTPCNNVEKHSNLHTGSQNWNFSWVRAGITCSGGESITFSNRRRPDLANGGRLGFVKSLPSSTAGMAGASVRKQPHQHQALSTDNFSKGVCCHRCA